jgi:hypothetical protein
LDAEKCEVVNLRAEFDELQLLVQKLQIVLISRGLGVTDEQCKRTPPPPQIETKTTKKTTPTTTKPKDDKTTTEGKKTVVKTTKPPLETKPPTREECATLCKDYFSKKGCKAKADTVECRRKRDGCHKCAFVPPPPPKNPPKDEKPPKENPPKDEKPPKQDEPPKDEKLPKEDCAKTCDKWLSKDGCSGKEDGSKTLKCPALRKECEKCAPTKDTPSCEQACAKWLGDECRKDAKNGPQCQAFNDVCGSCTAPPRNSVTTTSSAAVGGFSPLGAVGIVVGVAAVAGAGAVAVGFFATGSAAAAAAPASAAPMASAATNPLYTPLTTGATNALF